MRGPEAGGAEWGAGDAAAVAVATTTSIPTVQAATRAPAPLCRSRAEQLPSQLASSLDCLLSCGASEMGMWLSWADVRAVQGLCSFRQHASIL